MTSSDSFVVSTRNYDGAQHTSFLDLIQGVCQPALVLVLECAEPVLQERARARQQVSRWNGAAQSRVASTVRFHAQMLAILACRMVWNASSLIFLSSIPFMHSVVFLVTGNNRLQERDDDQPVQLTRRFDSFERETRPVVEEFKRRGSKVVKVSEEADCAGLRLER